ncbi:MAG TPA: WD40 repeat domain-containing protein, partial [Terracidiphilus sp.]|nr:WD40 repeat domain-containing protein [Terracidiphilus sp.]
MIYDSYLKEFFFSNPLLNEIEAYSSVDGHRVGGVTVPGPLGLSLSPDGTLMAVGTSTPEIYFVDPAALHVTAQVEVPSSFLTRDGVAPAMPFLMASGPVLIATGNFYMGSYAGIDLLSYDPATGAFAFANPPGTTIKNISGTPARSVDGNYLAVPDYIQSGECLAVYSAQSQSFISISPAQYTITAVAANPDGSQFATAGAPSSSSGQFLTLWNRNLQQQFQFQSNDTNILFSRDGKYLFDGGELNDSSTQLDQIRSLDTHTGLVAGYQGLSIAVDFRVTLSDTDENNRVYGITAKGAFVANAGQLQPAPTPLAQFQEGFLSVGNPDEGVLSGGTQVQFNPGLTGGRTLDELAPSTEAYFGTIPATSDVVAPDPGATDGHNLITATSPPSSVGGPVTVTLTDANNNTVLLPAAFSYGPHSHWIDPSAVSPNGGTVSTLLADGLFSYLNFTNGKVTVGGKFAITSAPTITGGDSWREVTVTTLKSVPGWADLKLTLNDGTSETTKNMVQVLQQDV